MKPAILVVEDDPNDVLFLQMALKKADVTYPIYVVKDGKEAMDYCNGVGKFADRNEFYVPYLVFLDLKLPHVMGLEVLRNLRQRPEFDFSIVIVLTSSKDPRDIDTAYQLRANAYLVKPSGLDGLQAIARSVKDFWLTKNQPPSVFSDPAPAKN